MRITKWTEYAVVMLQRLAACPTGTPVPIRNLTDKLPQDFCEQIMMKLRRQGIVKSTRGRTGGYVLNILPDMLSMLQVFDAVEPDTVLVNSTTCDSVAAMLQTLQYDMRDSLNGMSLASTMSVE